MSVLSLSGFHQEEQAGATSSSSSPPTASLGPLHPHSGVSWELGSQGSLGWMGGLCFTVTLLQIRCAQFRANVQQSLVKNHPHLKRKFAAWLHHGFFF